MFELPLAPRTTQRVARGFFMRYYASMSKKQAIIDRLIEKSAEIITEDEFKQRLESGDKLTHYIGFEISGYVHIGQGIMSALIMKDLTELGVQCTIWLADWHTWINNKLDGKLTTAKRIGKGYFTEAIKASYKSVGGNPEDLEFRSADDWYRKNPNTGDTAYHYMNLEKLIEKHITLSRMQRSISIMGRKEGSEVDFATLTYPAMQVADIFYQKIDIAHAGMDQRKAHVIMRDVADKINGEKHTKKAIALHHPLLMSLRGPQDEKMSKSDPMSAIFVHDTADEIEQKIKKAFCPEKQVEDNPVLNWAQYLLFWNRQKPFVIKRKEEHGGNLEMNDFASLKTSYENGSLHPMDLKAAVSQELINLLAPAREHFNQPEVAAKKKELDEVMANR